MAVFVLSSKFLVISDNQNELSKVLIYDLKSDKLLNTIDWPKHVSTKSQTNARIVCACFSLNSELFAATDSTKQLIIWSINQSSNELLIIRRYKLERNAIKILFSGNGDQLISGDKSGNVYSFAVNTDMNCEQLLLGHCSMLLDLSLSASSKYLVTCDRDEKIRVSNYPNCYNIESYCLGHNEFVSTIQWVSNDAIISGSGDESLRLWNAINGEQLKRIEFRDINSDINDNQTKFAVKKLATNQLINPNLVAICFYDKPLILIYELNRELEFKRIHSIDSLDNQPIDIYFDLINRNLLWILLPVTNNPFKIYEINEHTYNQSLLYYPKILDSINSNTNFIDNCLNESNIKVLDGLYKHWFNNVDIYMQKKNERLKVNKKAKVMTK